MTSLNKKSISMMVGQPLALAQSQHFGFFWGRLATPNQRPERRLELGQWTMAIPVDTKIYLPVLRVWSHLFKNVSTSFNIQSPLAAISCISGFVQHFCGSLLDLVAGSRLKVGAATSHGSSSVLKSTSQLRIEAWPTNCRIDRPCNFVVPLTVLHQNEWKGG